MTLEFERLTDSLVEMAQSAVRRQQQVDKQLAALLDRLHSHAADWDTLAACLQKAQDQMDAKFFRAARPSDTDEPLDAAVPSPACPPTATLLATDGSQIIPDRHAAFLYYLINVGVIVYYHGCGRPPETLTVPRLDYPREELFVNGDVDESDDFAVGRSAIGVRRDLAEIGTLADTAWQLRHEPRPLLTTLDQRLLYWPVGSAGASESKEAILSWLAGMTKIRDAGGLLAGYIDRPGKSSVVTLLQTLDVEQPGFDPHTLTGRAEWQRPTDVALFSQILRPGQRSKVFVDVSEHNTRFAENDPLNEVCFFYLNPGRHGSQIARVDIPRWVAEDKTAVDTVHALLYDQCQLLGDYPYLLARADEMAVVGRQDQAELDFRIALSMQAVGLEGTITAKQQSKEAARSGRTRYEM
ncbi:MAG: DNA double-strand break repair nuclease NurA [Chloroflexota bacterium]